MKKNNKNKIQRVNSQARHSMDRELALLLLFTRNLPKIKGAGRLANVLKNFYLRKKRDSILIDVLGFKMELNPGESVSNNSCLFMPQLYDYKEMGFIKENLKEGDVFIDAGAHIGFYSLIASKRVGESGVVLAIEADSSMYKKLNRNIKLNSIKNIKTFLKGLSNEKGVLTLNINNNNRGASSFLNRAKSSTTVKVDTLPLLDIIRDQGITKVKGIKIDIEGYEYKVLKGFFSSIEDSSVLPEL